jgi:transcriptional regulator
VYLPKHFAIEDQAACQALITENAFGMLIANGENGPEISHLPFLLDAAVGEQGQLRCHVARANPIWRLLEADPRALCLFNGAHAYISPDWYEDTKLAPTWNYAAVHVTGPVRILEAEDTLRVVEDLAAQEEGHLLPKQPWMIGKIPEKSRDMMVRAIVGIEISIERIEAKAKLGQNRPAADRTGAIDGLRARGGDTAAAVADMMERTID